MKRLRCVNLVVVLTLLTGWLAWLPAPVQAAPAAFDCSTATGMPQSECEALVALYESTEGDNWNDNTGWLATNTPCDWYGVTCADSNVTRLTLWENQLSGPIPSEIGNFTALRILYLYDNQISGVIPPQIGNLIALERLWLGNNQLNGPIPSTLGDLTALETLRMDQNQLGGSIPSEIGNLAALTYLQLDRNQLSGVIPPEIGALDALTGLYLHENQLSGPIPTDIGNLTGLTTLALSNNQLSGTIPSEIGILSALRYLSLFGNQLSDSIPPEIGNLTALTRLDLGHNQLSGPIPSEIGDLSALTRLSLSSNQLSGPIPTEIGSLAALERLYLGWNQLSGEIPSEIGNLSALTELSLWGNDLSGAIPPEIGNLSALTSLWLTSNQLSGSIPSEIGQLTALERFQLSFNQLSGEIPTEIGNLIALTSLRLAGNQLSGEIPAEIGDLTALTGLYLDRNQLSGPIPPEIGDLTALTGLDLDRNQLSGPIPPEIGNLIALTELDLWNNQLNGEIPPEIGTLTALTSLSLSWNQLSGEIPAEIGDLTALEHLSLHGNQLSGEIPPEIGNLTALTYLSLHNNQLSGPLPPEIGNLSALGSLSLNNNQLSGEIPAEIGNLTALTGLFLYDNDLTGEIPPEIGDLTALTWLRLHDNPFSGEVPTALTSLTLDTFTFYDTDWCAPSTGDVHAWLSSIPDLYGTGLICGEDLGSLSGAVTLTDTTPAADVQVNLYRSTSWPRWQYLTTTHTAADGMYQFTDLGQGLSIDYRVQFVDPTHHLAPQYYDAQPTIGAADVITITPGVPRTGIDAVLDAPQPPAATIDTSGSVTQNPLDGTATINMVSSRTDDITVTRAVTCAGDAPSAVTLTLDPPGTVYSMTLVSGDDYQATIPGADITQDADIVVAATCGVTTTETTVGHVNLYDPSGFIRNQATGQPVEGATVTLYNVPGWEPKTGPDDDRPNTCQSNDSKDPDDPWSQPAPTELGVIVNPEVTTVDPSLSYQHTDNAGYYGWDVGEGCWYIEVTAEGYDSLTSPVVGVPPEVTDLNLALMPEGFNVQVVKSATPTLTITNGSAITYTLVVSASVDATLHLYDELDPNLKWLGFVGDVPETLTYTTALTGTVALSATTPLTVTFAAEVDLPAASFVNEYAQVSNTAYYYLPGETLMMMRPSNTVTRTIYDNAAFEIYLPLVVRES